MKTKKLLVLGALCLFGLSANAADLIERTQPTVADVNPVAVAFEADHQYLLYNVGAEMFFTQGSTWSTRGCVVPNQVSAVRIKAAKYTLDNVWDGKTYEILNYVTPRTGTYSWYKMCMNGAGDLYLDQTTWSRFVEIQDQGGNVYRIMPNELNNTVEGDNGGVVSDGTQFIGYAGLAWDGGGSQYDFGNDDNELRVPLSALTTENVDWQFYDASIFDVYDKSIELKAAIEDAEKNGVDVSAAVAVYNNLSSTVAQMDAAIEALKEALKNNLSGATVSDPKDATSYIANPNFDDGTSAGWSGTGPGMNGDGSHGAALVAEHYNKTFDTYQNLTGLPNGVYKLSAKTFFRGTYDDLLTGANKVAYLYVANGDSLRTFFNNAYSPLNTESFVDIFGSTTEFGTTNAETNTAAADGTVYYIPNNPSTFRLYCEAGYYDTGLYFEVTDGNMTIGVKKDQNVPGSTTDWAVFDTFGLTYYGNASDAYAYWVEQVKANATDYSDKLVSTWALNDYNSVVNSISFSNNAQAAAAMKAIEDAEAVIAENATLWQQWKKKVDEATNFMSDEKYEAYIPDDMEQYINFDAEDIEDVRSLTNDEILAEIAKIDAWMEETKEAAANALKPGDDVTYLLTNPDFTGNANGWTIVKASGGNVAYGSNCYEAWNNSSFDIYQEVKNAPIGVYSISVQGFYRYWRGTNAWNAWNAQDNQYVKTSPCFVYLNDIQTPFMNVFAEAITDNSIFGSHTGFDTFDGYFAPNDMATAADCFAADSEVNPGEKMFTQKAFGLISNVGDPLRIGVKGSSNQQGDSWVIFDNFKLTYMGNDLPTIKEVLEPKIAEAKALEGWMGKSVYAALQQAIADAENPASGDAAFAALKNIVAAVENAKASMAKFDELRKALEDLNDLINSGNINENVKAEAQAFITDTRDDADEHIYEDSDVPELLAKIAELSTKLQKPKEGSDASPANWTVLIVNPDYVNNATDGWTSDASVGWNGENGYNVGEIFNATYDYYQEIAGLDEGTYEVRVKGFYRFGGHGPALDYENINDDSKSLAFLYANGGNGQSAKALTRLCTEYYNESGDGWSQIGSEEMYVPNGMTSAGTAIYVYNMYGNNDGNNSVIVKVNADGKLRIGVKKAVAETNDWTIFTGWELYNYGKNSTKQADGDAMGIDELLAAPAVRVEFFTIDGRRASAAQKGILIQKTTLQNGMVVVRKVRM